MAAAICHRLRDGGLEMLLVRTRGGDRWTFPKGHVEAGESPEAAAAREAREEAGVNGRVDPPALGSYLYPGGSRGEREVRVTAYLLEVLTQAAPAEPARQPTWMSPGEAKLRLAERRDPHYAAEHERIVEAAVERLVRPGRA